MVFRSWWSISSLRVFAHEQLRNHFDVALMPGLSALGPYRGVVRLHPLQVLLEPLLSGVRDWGGLRHVGGGDRRTATDVAWNACRSRHRSSSCSSPYFSR